MSFILLLFIILLNSITNLQEDEINETIDNKLITYGSTLKIQNVMTKFLYLYINIVYIQIS